IDRSGLVGEDGDTHHGVFDIAYLRHLPNMTIVQPADAEEAYAMLDYAFDIASGPVSLRYSNASVINEVKRLPGEDRIRKPSWRKIIAGYRLNLVCYGDNVHRMQALLVREKLDITLYNARFIKPFDAEAVAEILSSGLPTIVLEDVVVAGGLGSAMLEWAQEKGILVTDFRIAGLPDVFVDHGKTADLIRWAGLDDESILRLILAMMKPE
ncbi:MAG: transketolase C-terminal domain-containing protein, partial [bacterium]